MRLTKMLATVSAISLIASAAASQQAPAMLEGKSPAYAGKIAGMDAWTTPNSDELFLVSPDGRSVISGTVFNHLGVNIGAAYLGAAGTADPMLAPDLVAEAELGVAPEETSMEGQGGVALTEMSMPTAQTVASDAEAAMQGLSETDRSRILLALVEGIRGVETEEDFRAALLEWRQTIDDVRAENDMPAFYTDDGARIRADIPSVAEQPASLDASARIAPEMPDTTASVSPQVASMQQASETIAQPSMQDRVDALLEDVRFNGMWFGLGTYEAPVVYAFIDPNCPYCADAIDTLSPMIGNEALQLRIVLVPALGGTSPEMIAGIFSAENPPLAFFDHEIAKAQGKRSELEPARVEDLPAPVQAGMTRNLEMVRDHRIPGVPFFVWDTEAGASTFAGVPDPQNPFPGMVRDSYDGDS